MTIHLRNVAPACCLALIITALPDSTADAHGGGHDRQSEPSIERAPSARELVEAAQIAQKAHRFDEAADLLERALTLEPDNDAAWLMSASLHLLVGRVDEAASACRRIRHLPLLAVLTCRARVRIARGEFKDALAEIETALAIEPLEHSRPVWRAWATSVAGDAARMIDARLAVKFYRAALDIERNEQVRAALVDTLLGMGSLTEADRLLGTSHRSLALHVRRLIVDRRLGRDIQSAAESLDREFQRYVSDGDYTHGREMARFYLDVLPDARQAASIAAHNFARQREFEDRLLCERSGSCEVSTEEV
ncbi:MAG: tetratricopeptide repeat protein [Pseudomonadota bacterium]